VTSNPAYFHDSKLPFALGILSDIDQPALHDLFRMQFGQHLVRLGDADVCHPEAHEAIWHF
jgi:hypothetical protein